jgi:DNA replication protein DnaC
MPDPTTLGNSIAETIAHIQAAADIPRWFIRDEDDPSALDDPEMTGSPAWNRAQSLGHNQARIPYRYNQATTDNPEILEWVLGYLDNRREVPSLLLAGPTGTGKTHAAYAALRLIGESGKDPTYWRASSTAALYGDLRTRTGHDTEKAFRDYANCQLLMIDDLGAAKHSEWTEEITYRLIDHRYTQCLPSIFTTNVQIRDLAAALGERTASRLAEMTRRVVLEGVDRRRSAAA